MISLKDGVSIAGVRPEIAIAIQIASSVYDKHDYDFVITSCTDGTHSHNSLHYVGLAVDCRIYHIASKEELYAIYADVKEALGSEFDVVLESTHIHIEYQPEINR